MGSMNNHLNYYMFILSSHSYPRVSFRANATSVF